MNIKATWDGLCTPAQLYAVLAFVSIIFMVLQQQYQGIIVQAIFAAAWTFLLGWICTKGWSGLSWFLVLLPIILTLIFLVMAISLKKDIKMVVNDLIAETQNPQTIVAIKKEHFDNKDLKALENMSASAMADFCKKMKMTTGPCKNFV